MERIWSLPEPAYFLFDGLLLCASRGRRDQGSGDDENKELMDIHCLGFRNDDEVEFTLRHQKMSVPAELPF